MRLVHVLASALPLVIATVLVMCSPFSGQDAASPDAGGANKSDGAISDGKTGDAGGEGEGGEDEGDGGELIVATGQGEPTAIAVDTSGVYWANDQDGRVMQWNGSTAGAIDSTNQSPGVIALGNNSVVWGDHGKGLITLASESSPHDPLAVDASAGPISLAYSSAGTGFYWIGLFDNSLNILSSSTRASSYLEKLMGNPVDLTVEGSTLYYVDAANGVVYSAATNTPIPTFSVVASSQDDCESIAAYTSEVAWARPGSDIVGAYDTSMGTTFQISAGENRPASIAMDASGVYWLNLGTGELRHAPLGSNVAVETLAKGDNQTGAPSNYFHGIALGQEYVYRISYADGVIKRTSK